MFIPIGDDNSRRVRTPYVTWGLIAANAILWFLQLNLGEQFTYGYSAVPYEITHSDDLARAMLLEGSGQVIVHAPGPSPIQLTLLTSIFLHGSWMHIIGNMLYLVIFGDQIEDLLGHGMFLLFYLVCGVVAGLAQIAMDPESMIPCLGASGAIAGVLGAYLIKYPMNKVHVLFVRFVIDVPAFIVLGGWVVLQVIAQATAPELRGGGVAYMAHIGGFAAGVVGVLLLGGRRRRAHDSHARPQGSGYERRRGPW